MTDLYKNPKIKFLIISTLLILSGVYSFGNVVIENTRFRLEIFDNGQWKSIQDKAVTPARELFNCGRVPYFSKITAGYNRYPSSVVLSGNTLTVTYNGGTVVNYNVTITNTYVNFQVVSITGPRPTEICILYVPTLLTENVGSMLNAAYDDQTLVCVAATTLQSDCLVEDQQENYTVLAATALDSPGPTLEGAAAALIVSSKHEIKSIMKDISHAYSLVTNEDETGTPTRDTQLARESYWFIGAVTIADVNKIAQYSQRSKINQLLIGVGNWAETVGHFGVNKTYFPGGITELQNFVSQLNAMGIDVGGHTHISKIDKDDTYVSPIPDHRFWVDFPTVTLKNSISNTATTIQVNQSVAAWPKGPDCVTEFEAGEDKNREFTLSNEIIKYTSIGPAGINDTFYGCTRGAYATNASSHDENKIIEHWRTEGSGRYIIDQTTSLHDEVTDNLATVFNQAGFNMIYFDGSEDVRRDRMSYFASLGQLTGLSKISRRPFKYLSGMGANRIWHSKTTDGTIDIYLNVYRSRPMADWPTVREHIDISVKRAMSREKSFMPCELGWFGLWPRTEIQGTWVDGLQYDQIEYLLTKSIAFNSPISLETSFSQMEAHPLTGGILDLVGKYEQMRLAGRWGSDITEPLREIGKDYAFVEAANPAQAQFVKVTEINQVRETHDIRCWQGTMNNGDPVFFVWHYTGQSCPFNISQAAMAGKNLKAYDVLGNQVTLQIVDGQIIIPVNENRLTLIFENCSEELARRLIVYGKARDQNLSSVAYIPPQSVNVQVSSQYTDAGRYAVNMINNAGIIDANLLLHDNNKQNAWTTASEIPVGLDNPYPGITPAKIWAVFDFENIYTLDQLWVWNLNWPDYSHWGLRNVAIEYSETGGSDSSEWTKLGDFEFAQATEEPGYAHNTEIDFNGINAKYIAITTHDVDGTWRGTWGSSTHGLSEVRFYIITNSAIDEKPVNGSQNLVPGNFTLSWQSGIGAVSHDIYISDDANEIVNAGTSSPCYLGRIDPNFLWPKKLKFGKQYFWAIDEIDSEGRIWPGQIWNFATAPDVSSANSVSTNTLSWHHPVNGNAGRMVVLGVTAKDNNQADMQILTAKYNGNQMTPVANSQAIAQTSPALKSELFYILDNDIGAAGFNPVEITFADQVQYCAAAALTLDNTAQQGPVDTASNAYETGIRGIFVNLTAASQDAIVIDVVGCANPGNFTPLMANQEIYDISNDSLTIAGSILDLPPTQTDTIGWEHSNYSALVQSAAAFNRQNYFSFTELKSMVNQWLETEVLTQDHFADSIINLKDFAIISKSWLGQGN